MGGTFRRGTPRRTAGSSPRGWSRGCATRSDRTEGRGVWTSAHTPRCTYTTRGPGRCVPGHSVCCLAEWRACLLDVDGGAGLAELRRRGLGLVLRHAFLHRLRGRLDQVLGLLQAEAGQLADRLDDVDLVRAEVGQHHAELGLLLDWRGGSSVTTTTSGGGRGHRHGGSHAPAILKRL